MKNTNAVLLNEEQKRFYDLITPYPHIAKFWDWDKREIDVDIIEAAVPKMSHGEQLLAHFFVSVWLGKSTWGIDVVDAADALGKKERMMIAGWLVEPFWP